MTGVFLVLASAACSGPNMTGVPASSKGDEGNGLQDGSLSQPPPFKPGPPVVDASCFVGETECDVSFSENIFPNMRSTGAWQCASSACHGGGQKPVMSDGDVHGTYDSLVNYELLGDHTQYVIPCNEDPSQSAIVCNLNPNDSCGSLMPITTGNATPLTPADVGLIAAWIECGAPDN